MSNEIEILPNNSDDPKNKSKIEISSFSEITTNELESISTKFTNTTNITTSNTTNNKSKTKTYKKQIDFLRIIGNNFFYFIPILFFAIGQFIQYILYIKSNTILLLDNIIEQTPLSILIISSIVNLMLLALIIFLVHESFDDIPIFTWIMIGISSILFLVIPAVSSAVMLFLYPLITAIYLNNSYFSEEKEFNIVISIIIPIITLIAGLFIQNYIFKTTNKVLFCDIIFGYTSKSIDTITMVLGIIATLLFSGTCCYLSMTDAPIIGMISIVLSLSFCMLVSPLIAAIVQIIFMVITIIHENNVERERIASIPIVISFILGQYLMILNFLYNKEVFIISQLNTLIGFDNFHIRIYIAITSILSFILAVVTYEVIDDLIYVDQVSSGLVIAFFTIGMLVCPSVATMIIALGYIVLLFNNENEFFRRVTFITVLSIVVVFLIVSFSLVGSTIGLNVKFKGNKINYQSQEEGSCYASHYIDSDNFTIVPF